jgi:hypothetical protein
MALWPQFVDGSYTTRSANIDAEATLNLYKETVDSASNPKKAYLIGTPGITYKQTAFILASGGTGLSPGCRGLWTQNGRTFGVFADTLNELTLTGTGATLAMTVTSRGSVGQDGLPVFFASNGSGSPGGNQLAISSNGALYILNLATNILTGPIVTPLTNPAGPVLFLNGYFLLHELNTLKVWFSELEDGTLWNALDWFARSNTSDNFVGMVALHDQIKVFGTKTGELYYNAGEADNPFLPYPGSVSMDGAVSRFAIKVLGESIIWAAKNEWDVIRAMRAGSGEATVISTPAVEYAWGQYTTTSDLEMEAYEQEGHPFAVFTFPTADATWIYDLREASWHQRTRWDGVVDHRWRVRGICAPGLQVLLVGDYLQQSVGVLSLDVFAETTFTGDPGTAIHRLRRAPYVAAENQLLFLDEVELGLQPGVGTALTPAPTVNLRVSRDFGTTYTALITAAIGAAGAALTRAIWRRLGRSRADRLVLEVSQTDRVRCVWGPGLHLRVTPGSGQL